MKTNEATLREIYNKSNSEVKTIMEQEFPTLFKGLNLLEKAIETLSEKDEEVIKLRKLETVCEKGCNILAEQKLRVLIKWKNNGWKPNWSDSNEYKYFIWWNMKENCFNGVNDYFRSAAASSRLCFKSKEDAEKMVKNDEVISLYKQYFNQ
jgi:hypothetical protein